MTALLNLESMSYQALSKLEVQITTAMIKRYEKDTAASREKEAQLEAQQVALRQKVAAMAADLNAATTKVFGKPAVPTHKANGRGKGHTSAVAIKYRDPKNSENTWSGRGRAARWLAQYEKAGRKRDEFLVA